MRTTDILSQEHRVIEQVLSCLEKLVTTDSAPTKFDWKSAGQILDFLKNFADRCHHGKEEEKLFPAMEARGFSPTAGPTAIMRFEHKKGRELMAVMSEAFHRGSKGDPTAFARFDKAAHDYVQLLRAHIHKEDSCLFPMANNFLKDADDAELVQQFDAIEHEPRFEGEHEKYLALADELAERFGVDRATTGVCLQPCGCHH
jgi:hemerythrin-like domain-containing protein